MIDGSVPAPRIVSLLVTRDTCLRVGGFDESLVLAEDNDFVLRVLQQGPLTAVPKNSSVTDAMGEMHPTKH